MKDLLRVADLTPKSFEKLLRLADEARRTPHNWSRLLDGETVVCFFAKPSTRTRLSFGTAIGRLGGIGEFVGPTELQLGRGETIEDTARVISRYAKAFVIRTFLDDDVRRFAAAASIPVVNALTDQHHPCQALADLLTIRRRFGSLRGVRVAYLGDSTNVTHSLMEAGALAGMDIAVASPPGFQPDPEVAHTVQAIAMTTGAVVRVTDDPWSAATGADVVYTDVWLSMGVGEEERASRSAALSPYRVDADIMSVASPSAIFMHCLPAHRGDEVTADVIDGPQSLVFEQAENRLHAAVAVLVALVRHSLTGVADVGRSRLAPVS